MAFATMAPIEHQILCILLFVLVVAAADEQLDEQQPLHLLNFTLFKAQFNKHYATPTDELRRQQLYLARALRVLVSVVRFRLGQCDYYLSINRRSDQTLAERCRGRLQLVAAASDELGGRQDQLQPVQLQVEAVGARRRRATPESSIGGPRAKHKEDRVFADLTQTGCFVPVESQGDCGACYAFATLSLFEHLYCRATGRLLAFSKQFMVSCGKRLHAQDMDQCEGAFLGAALRFVDQFGLELAEHWPYEARNGTCRLTANQKGLVQLDGGAQFGYVLFEDFDEYLRHRPILFSLNVPRDFDDYGGGVLAGAGCGKQESHAMLIVGHGRENGREYYLFRNSYGEDWGEQGYLKFRKSHTSRCSGYMFGFGSQASFPADHFQRLSAKLGAEPNTFGRQPRAIETRANGRRERLLRPLHPEFREDGEHDPSTPSETT